MCPVAADGVVWSVCLSVCQSVMTVRSAKKDGMEAVEVAPLRRIVASSP